MKTKIFIIIVAAITLAFGTAKAQTETKTETTSSEKAAKETVEQVATQIRIIKEKMDKGEIKTEDAVAEAARKLTELLKQLDEKNSAKKGEKRTEIIRETKDKDGKTIIEKEVIVIREGKELEDMDAEKGDKKIKIIIKDEDGKIVSEDRKIIKKDDDDDDDDDDNDDNDKNKSVKDLAKKLKVNKNSNRRTKMYFTLALGVNGLQKGDNNTDLVQPNIDTWKSRNVEFGILLKTRLGGVSSPVKVYYGLTYNRFGYVLKGQDFDYKADPNAYPEAAFTNVTNIKDARLKIGYAVVPLGLEFRLGKSGNLALGGYAGLRTRTSFEKEYNSVRDVSNHDVKNARFGMNNTIYGAQASIGKGGLSLYGKINLSDLYSDGKYYNPYAAGIKWDF